MSGQIGRREFVAGATTAGLLSTLPAWAASLGQFKLGVITDEISQDLAQALSWAKGFGLKWVELRFVWDKYITEFTAEEVTRAKDLLSEYGMSVSVIDSPYFKTLLPGTTSKFNDPKNDKLQSDFASQQGVLERAFARAKDFGTDKVRIFSFLRVGDPKSVFDRVAKELDKTAAIAVKEKVRLILENEFSCNVATGRESGAILQAVKSPAFGLNWDPGNAYAAGERKPYPDGYDAFDHQRMWHMHLKDAQDGPGGESVWRPMGGGKIDYPGQFRALLKNGYDGTLSLETHYLNAEKNKQASSTESIEGLLKLIQSA